MARRRKPLDWEDYQKRYIENKVLSKTHEMSKLDIELELANDKFRVFEPRIIPNETNSCLIPMRKRFYTLFNECFKERFLDSSFANEKCEIENIETLFKNFKQIYNGFINDKNYYTKLEEFKVIIKYFLFNKSIDISLLDKIADNFIFGTSTFFLELFVAIFLDEPLTSEEYLRRQLLLKTFDAEYFRKGIPLPKVLVKLWENQINAFKSWKRAKNFGIVEMATATGKTIVGMKAIEYICNDMCMKWKPKCKILIITNSRAILNQWKSEIIEKMGIITRDQSKNYEYPLTISKRIHSNKEFKIIIEFQTFQKIGYELRQETKNGSVNKKYKCNLMIVDEVHHGAGPSFKEAIKIPADAKLGLSATIEGQEKTSILAKTLGEVVYQYTLKQAVNDNIIPKFDWIVKQVPLSIDETTKYIDITNNIKNLFYEIQEDYYKIKEIAQASPILNKSMKIKNYKMVTMKDFIDLMKTARYQRISYPSKWQDLQNMLFLRRQIIHKSKPKLEKGIELIKSLRGKKKCIVFTMDIESCDYIGEQLNYSNNNRDIFIIHSKQTNDVNKKKLDLFKKSITGILISPKMLDEGIDIPDAEIGINIASTKSRLQLVQRIGRIVRKKEGKKPVFYHFIASIDKTNEFIPEDSAGLLDELSWVHDTASFFGSSIEIDEDVIALRDHYIKEERNKFDVLSKLTEIIQNHIDISVGGFGSINVGNILGKMDRIHRQNLIGILRKINKNWINNDEWCQILRESMGLENLNQFLPKDNWWILSLGENNPQKILNIVEKVNEAENIAISEKKDNNSFNSCIDQNHDNNFKKSMIEEKKREEEKQKRLHSPQINTLNEKKLENFNNYSDTAKIIYPLRNQIVKNTNLRKKSVLVDTDSILNVISDGKWYTISQIVKKMKITDAMDIKFLQLKLKGMYGKGLLNLEMNKEKKRVWKIRN